MPRLVQNKYAWIMKRILILTDFSSSSRRTLRYVFDLIKNNSEPCKIILLNTYMVQETNPELVIKKNDQLKMISKDGLEAELIEAQSLNENKLVTIETASHMGSLHNIVLMILKSDEIDLVAMGKNGGRQVNMISSLLKEHHCPLLITEPEEEMRVN